MKNLAREVRKDLLLKVVKAGLKEGKFQGDYSKIEGYIDKEYNLFENVNTINPLKLTASYKKFLATNRNILKEAEEEVEQIDKAALFQDLSDVTANLSDSFAKLYNYKGQYIENPQWKQALSKLRVGVSELINQMASTMSMIGIENDQPQQEEEEF